MSNSGSPQRRRSSVNIGFQENVSNFQKQPINFEQWEPSVESSNEETLRNFLKKQAEAEFDDLKMRLEQLKGEAKDIKSHLETFRQAAHHLHTISDKYAVKAEKQKAKREEVHATMNSILQQVDAQKALAGAAQEAKRDLMNDRNKELLGCNEKNFTAIVAEAAGNPISDKKCCQPSLVDAGVVDLEVQKAMANFLLDTFAAFYTGNAEAKHTELQEEQFASAGNFQMAGRAATGEGLTWQYLETVRGKITGGDNEKCEKGDVWSFMVDEKLTNANMGFFPYFRTLSKMWHFISQTRKMNRHVDKMKQLVQDSKQVEVRVKSHEEKVKALAIFDVVQQEARDIDECEGAFFQKRYDHVERQIQEIEEKLHGTNFADSYFQQ